MIEAYGNMVGVYRVNSGDSFTRLESKENSTDLWDVRAVFLSD